MKRVWIVTLSCGLTLLVAASVAIGWYWQGGVAAGRHAYRDLLEVRETLERPVTRRPVVVWLGDSTIMGKAKVSYPRRLEERLRGTLDVENRIVATGGLHFESYFCLMGAVLTLKPDAVVVIANPTQFRGPAIRPSSHLCALMPRDHLPGAMWRALRPGGVPLSTLLSLRLLGVPGVRDPLFFLTGLRRAIQSALVWDWLGTKATEEGKGLLVWGGDRGDARLAIVDSWRNGLGSQVRADEPVMETVRATVRMAARRGVPIIVIGHPVPYDRLRAEAAYDPADFRRRFPFREAVEQAGGLFVDLHDAVAESGFRDRWVHLNAQGTERMATLLEPVMRRVLARPEGG